MVSVINAGLIHSRRRSVEDLIQEQVTGLIGKYGWMFLAGAAVLLFRSTIETSVAGFMIFMGNDYNEDDVVEVDGKPSRIVRVGMWSTTFFTYDVRDGIIVGGSKLVVQNDKLKDLKIDGGYTSESEIAANWSKVVGRRFARAAIRTEGRM